VNVTNIQNIKGRIKFGLYNNAKSFPKVKKQFKVGYATVTGKTATYTFKGLKKGEYAIGIFHDENKDGKCNRNAVGYPTEAFGFSRNVRPFLSAPSFESARIKLNSDRAISIKLE
jgi:uncharacterized protein (DUF2141 family)